MDAWEQHLQDDKAVAVDDEGFSDRTLARLPSGARRARRWPIIAALSVGIVLAALVPNGSAALSGAIAALVDGHATTPMALAAGVSLVSMLAWCLSQLTEANEMG